MELKPENAEIHDAVYEGVLTSDHEGNYRVTQGQKSARINTQELNDDILEENDGETISVIGTLSLEQNGDSAILSYELKPRVIAPMEGYNPKNNTYITRLGEHLLEGYPDTVTDFKGEKEDLTEVNEISY